MQPERDRIKKSLRLKLIEDRLERTPEGLTTRELAERMGCSERSIQRDMNDLSETSPIRQEGNRWVLEPHSLPGVRFTLSEARAVFLAVRLFLKYADKGDAGGLAALQKLADVFPPNMADHVRQCHAILSERKTDEDFVSKLDRITEAWASSRRLRIRYQSWEADEPRTYDVEPYFLEPSGQGFATYLLARSRQHREHRVFKVERMQEIEVLAERFTPDPDFSGAQVLRGSWGIVWNEGGQDHLDVRLRFSPAVTRRVLESYWHPSQQVDFDEDGAVLVSFHVPGVMEIVPWVRGWGPDVEVLEPAALRERVREEAQRTVELYNR